MRLLHTTRFRLEEFSDSQVPKYCILSHRWGNDEVEFADVIGQRWKARSQSYRKVHGCCRLAKQRGFDWIWIDTCCIDKRSSAELSEAINSMFKYYSEAEFCIAYLSDVQSDCDPTSRRSKHRRAESFMKSVWFTRGWTLQELLAPRRLYFYDGDFGLIGSKAELSQMVSDATGIATMYLNGRRGFNEASIATRMSWASERQTTRIEDQAYSLLGIFGVSMPALYGEGEKAFFNLQQQIIKHSDDESIYAWICKGAHDDMPFGMLADSPRNFRHSDQVQRARTRVDKPPASWTGRGLKFSQNLASLKSKFGTKVINYEGKVALACKQRLRDRKGHYDRTVAIWLRKIDGAWYRFLCNKFYYMPELKPTWNSIGDEKFQTFYVPQPNLITTPRLHYKGQRDMIAMVRNGMQREKRDREDYETKKILHGIGTKVGLYTLGFAGVAAVHGMTAASKRRLN